MSATPKLFFNGHCDVPVWEIQDDETGKLYHVEREHHEGFVPIGAANHFELGSSQITSFEVVRERDVQVMKANPGDIPMAWYAKQEHFSRPRRDTSLIPRRQTQRSRIARQDEWSDDEDAWDYDDRMTRDEWI